MICFACGFDGFAPASFQWQTQFELHDSANPCCPMLTNPSANVALTQEEELEL